MQISSLRNQKTLPGLDTVTATILAGGLGTRLRQVVADRPKVLAEVQGRPFLSYLLGGLVNAGFKQAILCIGYLGEQVRSVYGDSYQGLQLSYSQEPAPLGTAGALRLALPLIDSESTLVMNGDSLAAVNLSNVWAHHQLLGVEGTMVLIESEHTDRFGKVAINEQNMVTSFAEKCKASGPGWINAGIYLLNRSLLESIPPDQPYSLERQMFPTWLTRGIYAYKSKGKFLDIGTPESYEAAGEFVSA